MVTSFQSGRTWFHNSERGSSFTCAIHPFSLSLSLIPCLMFSRYWWFFCREKLLDIDVNATPQSRAVIQIMSKSKSTLQYISTVLGLTKYWDSVASNSSRQCFWEIVHLLPTEINLHWSSGYFMYYHEDTSKKLYTLHHCVFVWFVYSSEQTEIISPYINNWLVFITEI